jgi:putative exporter of polyketide antibiotics
VTAQLASGARGARGLAIGALGLSFLLRAIGDSAGASGPDWLTWASPAGSAYGVSTVLRLSAQETGQGADLILSGAVGRVRWALGHLLIAALGMTLLLVVAGLATGLGYGLRTGGAGPETVRMLGAALAQLPAALVIAAVTAAAFGVVPRACAAAGWTALGLVTALSLFGPSLQLPRWATDISPFAFTPRLPGGAVATPPGSGPGRDRPCRPPQPRHVLTHLSS